jgi:hypothetical protein
MKRHVTAWTVVGLLATLLVGRAGAADDPGLLRDLSSTITLQGQPCGQVVSVVKQGDNDYIASCQDGNRYHVFVNAQGRVVVQKQ